MCLGVSTIPIAQMEEKKAKEFFGSRAPKVGIVVLDKDPGCEPDFQVFDIITHADRKVIKSEAELTAALSEMNDGKKHKLTFQRSINGKWVKGDVEFKPKTYKQLVRDNLAIEKDDVTGSTTYRDKRSPDSPACINLQCRFRVTKDGDTKLFARFSYKGDSWLGLDKCVVKVGDTSSVIELPRAKSEVSIPKFWEWSDTDISKEIELFHSIGVAKDVTVRFVGHKYTHDYEMTLGEQRAVRNILEAIRLEVWK